MDAVPEPVPTPCADALIVEDNVAFREWLRDLLATRLPALRIAEATDGEHGFEQFLLLHPSMVLVDVHLPRMSGLELTRQVKSQCAATWVCIITSHDLPEYRDAAVRFGADHFLVKGTFTAQQLVELVAARLPSTCSTGEAAPHLPIVANPG